MKGLILLNFPNESCSYDATRHSVRFWGYDGAMEVSFFITHDALGRIQYGMIDGEVSLLAAFRAHRKQVLEMAARVYARGRRGSYEVTALDVQ